MGNRNREAHALFNPLSSGNGAKVGGKSLTRMSHRVAFSLGHRLEFAIYSNSRGCNNGDRQSVAFYTGQKIIQELLGKRADTLRDNEDHDSFIVEHDDFIKGVMEYNREIVKYFIKRGVFVILLFRRNLFWRLISVLANAYDHEAKLLNVTHKSHVHSKQEAELLAAYKPVISVTFLIPNLNRIEEVTRDAVNFFRSTHHIVLCYEDLISDQKRMVEVEKFLKVPPRQLKSQQVKIHTRPLSDHVQNWNEVYKKLKGTKYESFLNESDYDL